MQSTHLIKRVLFYIGLSLISFLITVELDGIFRESRLRIFVIFVFVIPHYVFGLIFLKTKLILKLTVPLVTSLATFGILWTLIKLLYKMSLLKQGDIIMFFVYFFSTAVVWEIVYQILIRMKRHTGLLMVFDAETKKGIPAEGASTNIPSDPQLPSERRVGDVDATETKPKYTRPQTTRIYNDENN